MAMQVVEIGSATDVGQVRRSNEDSEFMRRRSSWWRTAWAACQAGEVASDILVRRSASRC